MPLDQNQRNQFKTWLDSHGIPPNCPACGTANSMNMGDVVAMFPVTGKTVNVGATFLPVAFVVCSNCKHLMFYGAAPIALAQE